MVGGEGRSLFGDEGKGDQVLWVVRGRSLFDFERLDGDAVSMIIKSLKRHGVSDEVIREALSEVA
ncbi:hypothetical protein B9G53_01250 [Pseudanabaena sp. SR411]|nr:hypothetical protein B9G53_01250 [Pseudanabaena sp. SR411]